MKSLEERVREVLTEEIAVVPYDASWPEGFEREKRHLLNLLPDKLSGRIEHFGSTAVPGLCAKPIIDMLIEVESLEDTRKNVAPALEEQGYDYFWRPSFGDDVPPFYAWFIKRGSDGARTHHIHMVEPDFEHWDRLFFRDYLISHPDIAREYGELKMCLATKHRHDRIAYTEAKTQFILKIIETAKSYYK